MALHKPFTVASIALFSCGCESLQENAETVELVAREVAEAAPIVASNPTFPGVLTAIVSVVAGIAGAGLGVAAQKTSAKNKVKSGALGAQAIKKVDSL